MRLSLLTGLTWAPLPSPLWPEPASSCKKQPGLHCEPSIHSSVGALGWGGRSAHGGFPSYLSSGSGDMDTSVSPFATIPSTGAWSSRLACTPPAPTHSHGHSTCRSFSRSHAASPILRSSPGWSSLELYSCVGMAFYARYYHPQPQHSSYLIQPHPQVTHSTQIYRMSKNLNASAKSICSAFGQPRRRASAAVSCAHSRSIGSGSQSPN